MYDLLLFDLDGTLCDPIDGISRCINHALTWHGFEPVEPRVVAPFIGPPLDVAFEAITGTGSAKLVDELIESYRERYSDIGYTECSLYPGVDEALRKLASGPVPLAVCTSKRSDFARRLLRMLELDDLFRFIDGGAVRVSKRQQMQRLRGEGRVSARSIMIGDRAVDLVAAHSNGVSSAGVLWGYGSVEELSGENPRYLIETPRALDVFLAGDAGPLSASVVVP